MKLKQNIYMNAQKHMQIYVPKLIVVVVVVVTYYSGGGGYDSSYGSPVVVSF